MTLRRQWTVAAFVAVACTLFMAFYTPLPQVSDEHLALPIARAVADPGLYPASDLVVSSGVRGPFFVYQLASVLYRNHMNVDAWWYAFLIGSLFALFVAIWWLAEGITGNAAVAALATALVTASSRYRGTIHWMFVPPSNFITSTLVLPLTFASFALAVRGKRGVGLVVAAFAFNLHPSLGLIAASSIAVLMIVDPRDQSWRIRIRWFGAAALAAFPNVWYLTHHASANFLGATAPIIAFADEFRLYAHHAFVEDHWRESYGWFIAQLGLMFFLRRQLGTTARRFVFTVTGWCVVLVLVYFANIYTVSVPAIDLTFLVRAGIYVKVIVFAAIAASIVEWVREGEGHGHQLRYCAATLLIVAVLHKNLDIGEGLLLVVLASLLFLSDGAHRLWRSIAATALAVTGVAQTLGQGWKVLHIAPFASPHADEMRLAAIGMAVVFCASAALMPADLRLPTGTQSSRPMQRGGGSTSIARALASCIGVLLFAVLLRGHLNQLRPMRVSAIASAMRLVALPADTRCVTEWAERSSPRASLIVIPPADERFNSFRLAAGRGVYVTVSDVDQLAYDAANYGEAHRRLLALGMRVLGRHNFDLSAYDTLDAAHVRALARDGASFAAFGRAKRATRPLPYPLAFQDSLWTVYDIRPTP